MPSNSASQFKVLKLRGRSDNHVVPSPPLIYLDMEKTFDPNFLNMTQAERERMGRMMDDMRESMNRRSRQPPLFPPMDPITTMNPYIPPNAYLAPPATTTASVGEAGLHFFDIGNFVVITKNLGERQTQYEGNLVEVVAKTGVFVVVYDYQGLRYQSKDESHEGAVRSATHTLKGTEFRAMIATDDFVKHSVPHVFSSKNKGIEEFRHRLEKRLGIKEEPPKSRKITV